MITQSFNKKMTKLTKPISIQIIKRFYPGPGIRMYLSIGTNNRILKIFNKNNMLLKQYSSDHIYIIANNLYQLEGRNRALFFKNLRQIAQNNEITFSKTAMDNPLFTSTINALAGFSRSLNMPLDFSTLSSQQHNEKKGLSQPIRSLSLEEKKEMFMKQHDAIINKMTILQKNYEKTKKVDWTIIEEWLQYIQNRGSVIPNYTLEEKNVNTFLKNFFIENTESQDVILSDLNDKLQSLKKQSNIPNYELFDNMEKECFTEEDYKNKIKAINDALKLLQTDKSLDNNALILLAIWSEAMLLDEENNPKLKREVYTLANNYPKEFQIKYTDKKPNSQEILQALKNKNYFVKQSSSDIPPGHIVSTAPLLHKTIVIPTKNGFYYAGMLTSSKTGTEILSRTQECNLGPEAKNKEQRFIVFSRFILCEDTNITVDLLALGFTHAINLEGEDVHQKIIMFFENKQNEWENNFIQELMVINPEVLKNITEIFYQKKLQIIEENYKQFCLDFNNMSEDKRKRYIENRLKNKEDKIKEQNENKFLSKLSLNFQKLFNSLNFFEKEMRRQEGFTLEREKKAKLKKQIEDQEIKSKKEKEERQRTGQLSAKEKREHYQKKIGENTENKTKYMIEDNEKKQHD